MSTNSNAIQITACDNEIIIVAYQSGASFVLANVESGNSYSVNVTINVAESTPQNQPSTLVLNGVTSNLSGTYTVYVPAGDYDLLFLGVDWGGPQNFAIAVNNNTVIGTSLSGDGLAYYSSPLGITV